MTSALSVANPAATRRNQNRRHRHNRANFYNYGGIATIVNLECEEREPADGENGNDDEEHAYNAFPFVESFGGGSVESRGREFAWCGMEPQRVCDMTVCHEHCQNLHQTVTLSQTVQDDLTGGAVLGKIKCKYYQLQKLQ